MILKKPRKRVVAAIAAGLLLASGLSVNSSAATVPNRFWCKPAGYGGGWCYQVNKHAPGVRIECQWKLSGLDGTKREMYYTSCPGPWGPDVL